jgi:hypothetical protein
MSLPRPIRPYHFQADLIWWDGPFNEIMGETKTTILHALVFQIDNLCFDFDILKETVTPE